MCKNSLRMHRIITVYIFVQIAYGATYQSYGETNNYATANNPLDQNPYKTNYGGDITSFPEATRYPNIIHSSVSSSVYSSSGSIYQKPDYSTPSYGYDQSYGQGYSGQSYNQGITSYEMPFVKYGEEYCVNRTPQNGIWINSLTGIWYGVEFIQHLAGDSRIDYGRTCITIHISEPKDWPSTEGQIYHVQHIKEKFHRDNRHLRLLWDEAGETIEYSLYFRNDSAGYWHVYDEQNGTLRNRPSYINFNGAVQIFKAVGDHLLLNFCQKASNNSPAQLYSVLFSRDPGTLARWEIESVHALLQNKNLSVASRRLVCGNSADRPISLAFSIISCLFAYIVSLS